MNTLAQDRMDSFQVPKNPVSQWTNLIQAADAGCRIYNFPSGWDISPQSKSIVFSWGYPPKKKMYCCSSSFQLIIGGYFSSVLLKAPLGCGCVLNNRKWTIKMFFLNMPAPFQNPCEELKSVPKQEKKMQEQHGRTILKHNFTQVGITSFLRILWEDLDMM